MAEYDDIFEYKPDLDGAGLRVGIVVARFNQDVADGLLSACTAELGKLGVTNDEIEIVTVPGALRQLLTPYLDREIKGLSPVEHALLLLSAFELRDHAQTPYKVVINEAIELAKSFGGTDGHKYVNGVLDKLAAELRSAEVKSNPTQRREDAKETQHK